MKPIALLYHPIFLEHNLGVGHPETPDRLRSILEAFKDLKAESAGRKLMFFPGQIKLFADGAIISQLMQMRDGYLDGHKGEWMIPPDELEKRAKLYWDAGYQLHIHVNGDAGLDVVACRFSSAGCVSTYASTTGP